MKSNSQFLKTFLGLRSRYATIRDTESTYGEFTVCVLFAVCYFAYRSIVEGHKNIGKLR